MQCRECIETSRTLPRSPHLFRCAGFTSEHGEISVKIDSGISDWRHLAPSIAPQSSKNSPPLTILLLLLTTLSLRMPLPELPKSDSGISKVDVSMLSQAARANVLRKSWTTTRAPLESILKLRKIKAP